MFVMTKTTRNFLSAAMIIAMSIAGLMWNHAHEAHAQTVRVQLPACAHEYSVNCAWDGGENGRSFVAIGTSAGRWLLYTDGTTVWDD
jgi:hypothetical protein